MFQNISKLQSFKVFVSIWIATQTKIGTERISTRWLCCCTNGSSAQNMTKTASYANKNLFIVQMSEERIEQFSVHRIAALNQKLLDNLAIFIDQNLKIDLSLSVSSFLPFRVSRYLEASWLDLYWRDILTKMESARQVKQARVLGLNP